MRVDVLVQATLDPTVFEIEYMPSAVVHGVEVPLRGIILVDDKGRRLLDLPDDGPVPDFDEEGLLLLAAESLDLPSKTITAEDINRNPRATNCGLVWRARSYRVPPGDRVRILHHLDEHGPCQLIEVAATVRSSVDGVNCVLSLACEDLVELDLVSKPLGPWTTVRRRARRDSS